jgi:hypothetical protein
MLLCLGKKKFSRELEMDASLPRPLLLLRCPSSSPLAPEAVSLAPPHARVSRARPGRRRARRDPVPAWFPSDLLTLLLFCIVTLSSSWCTRCWERGGREEELTSIDLIHQAPQLEDGIPRAASALGAPLAPWLPCLVNGTGVQPSRRRHPTVTETISECSANWSEYYPRMSALLSIKLYSYHELVDVNVS